MSTTEQLKCYRGHICSEILKKGLVTSISKTPARTSGENVNLEHWSKPQEPTPPTGTEMTSYQQGSKDVTER